MIRPPFTTPNWSDHKAYCAHCSNSGMVVIDGYSREVITTEGAWQPGLNDTASPCPMCERGKNFDAAGWNLAYNAKESRYYATGEGAGWWQRHDLGALSWENGYTVRHVRRCQLVPDGRQYPCGQPATGAYCDYHAQNRPGVVGSVKQLARSVETNEVMTTEEATA
jgi:hypothetical protein